MDNNIAINDTRSATKSVDNYRINFNPIFLFFSSFSDRVLRINLINMDVFKWE